MLPLTTHYSLTTHDSQLTADLEVTWKSQPSSVSSTVRSMLSERKFSATCSHRAGGCSLEHMGCSLYHMGLQPWLHGFAGCVALRRGPRRDRTYSAATRGAVRAGAAPLRAAAATRGTSRAAVAAPSGPRGRHSSERRRSSAAAAPLLGLLRAEWTVGDLGTGTGALAETIAPFVQKVIGVDRSGEMLEAAKVRTESLDSVDLRLGELEGLPIEDAELDVAILALVLHYVVDPVAVLHEVARALKPGGSVIILDMREHQRGVGYLEDMGHVWPGFATADLRSWLERSGFSGINVTSLRPDLSASGPPLFLASARNS